MPFHVKKPSSKGISRAIFGAGYKRQKDKDDSHNSHSVPSSSSFSSSLKDAKKYDILPPWESPEQKQQQHHRQRLSSSDFDTLGQEGVYHNSDAPMLEYEAGNSTTSAATVRETRDVANGSRRATINDNSNNSTNTDAILFERSHSFLLDHPSSDITSHQQFQHKTFIPSSIISNSKSNIDLLLMDDDNNNKPTTPSPSPRLGSLGGRKVAPSIGSTTTCGDDALFDELVSTRGEALRNKTAEEVREPQATTVAYSPNLLTWNNSSSMPHHSLLDAAEVEKSTVHGTNHQRQTRQDPPSTSAIPSPPRDPPGKGASFSVLPEDPSGDSVLFIETARLASFGSNGPSPCRGTKETTCTTPPPPQQHHTRINNNTPNTKVSTLIHQFETNSPKHQRRTNSHGDLKTGKAVQDTTTTSSRIPRTFVEEGNTITRLSAPSRRASTGGNHLQRQRPDPVSVPVLEQHHQQQQQQETRMEQDQRYKIFPRTSPTRAAHNRDEARLATATTTPFSLPTEATKMDNSVDTFNRKRERCNSDNDDFDVLAAQRSMTNKMASDQVLWTNDGSVVTTNRNRDRCNSDDFDVLAAQRAATNKMTRDKVSLINDGIANGGNSNTRATAELPLPKDRCNRDDFDMLVAHRGMKSKVHDTIVTTSTCIRNSRVRGTVHHPARTRCNSDDFDMLASERAAKIGVPTTANAVDNGGENDHYQTRKTPQRNVSSSNERCKSNDFDMLASQRAAQSGVTSNANTIDNGGGESGRQTRKTLQRSISSPNERSYLAIGLLDSGSSEDCTRDQGKHDVGEPSKQARPPESRRVLNADDPSKCTFWVLDSSGLCYLELDVENTMPNTVEEFLAQKGDLIVDGDDRLQLSSKLWNQVNHASSTAIEASSAFARSCVSPKNKKSSRGRRKLRPSLSFRAGSTKSRLTRSFSFNSVR